MQLICAFVLACAKSRFSHDMAQKMIFRLVSIIHANAESLVSNERNLESCWSFPNQRLYLDIYPSMHNLALIYTSS